MKNERNSSFELLRLLCIFGIIMMHTFAGVDTSASALNTSLNVLANSLFNTGVTCFILISGYFGIRFSLEKLIRLDLMIILFTVLHTLITGNFGVKDLIRSCIPVLSRQYWFITCYFVLCILAPFLNQIPEKLSKEAFRRLLLVMLLVFSVIPTFGIYDVMQDAGKGLVHFVMIYLLGRYLALYENRPHKKSRLALGALLSTLIVFAADSILTMRQHAIYTTFSRDCSIFIIFTAVMLLLLFREFTFQNNAINRIAGSVLAIYVLDQTIRYVLYQFINPNDYSESILLIFILILFVLAVMLIAVVVNEIRKFTIGRIEPFLEKVIAAVIRKILDILIMIADKVTAVFL